MKEVSDINPTENWKVLLFGAPGAGKTWLAGTWPEPVFIDTDDGMKVFTNKAFLKANPKKRIRYETFTDPIDKHGAFTKATGFWKAIEFSNEVIEMPDVKTLVYDSISSLQGLAMHVGMELSGQHRKSHTVKKMADARKGTGIPVAIPTQADYGSEMAVFSQFMDKAVTIPKHVIFIAHERDVTGDGGALLRRDPLLTGQAIRAMVARWFDEVWYLDIASRGKRILITESTNTLKSVKSRSGVANRLEHPTYDSIMETVK